MSEHSKLGSGYALWRWQLRQECDGYLLTMMVLLSSLPVVIFLAAPTAGSALVMVSFLLVLGVAGLRLLISAAKVAELQRAISPSREITDVNLLSYSQVQSAAAVPELKMGPRSASPTPWNSGPEYLN